MLYNKWWKIPSDTCMRNDKGKENKANALGVDNIGEIFNTNSTKKMNTVKFQYKKEKSIEAAQHSLRLSLLKIFKFPRNKIKYFKKYFLPYKWNIFHFKD